MEMKKTLCKKWNTQSDGAHIHGATNPSTLSKFLIYNNNQTYSKGFATKNWNTHEKYPPMH